MNAFDFTAALAPGTTLVTPNKRLARHFVTGHDKAQLAAGRRAWVAGRAMPWQGWLQSLWLDALAADALPAPRILVGTGAAAHLWDRIVAQESPELLDAGGASADAAEAWSLFHAWRQPDDRFEGWSRAGIGDDAAAFARWAQRYRAALAENGLVDAAQLADRLAACATRVRAWRNLRIVTIGFIEFAPQQQRLLAALRDAGAEIVERTLPQVAGSRPSRVVCATPEAELGQALAWARDRALANPGADVAIVVADLASRRAEVAARAEDILCPALASRVQPDAPRPYDISLGIALADVPMIATAIDLIALGGGALPMPQAAALLRSAHLPDAEARWTGRAMTERRWREQGARKVTPADVVRALDASGDPLAARWRDAAVPARGARSPAQWASDWRAWLAALGWPGTRPLGSGEWQAGEAWSQLLATFGTFAGVTPILARDDALAALRALAARTVFQPEAPPARIRIMGLLEASGLVFDALWIAGMNAESWPPAQAPHPMLPLAWQRERRVPRSDAAGDLAHARVLTEGFAGAASEVVASHARQVDGLDRAGSALVAAWPEFDVATLPPVAGLAGAIATSTRRIRDLRRRTCTAACRRQRGPGRRGHHRKPEQLSVPGIRPVSAARRHLAVGERWPDAAGARLAAPRGAGGAVGRHRGPRNAGRPRRRPARRPDRQGGDAGACQARPWALAIAAGRRRGRRVAAARRHCPGVARRHRARAAALCRACDRDDRAVDARGHRHFPAHRSRRHAGRRWCRGHRLQVRTRRRTGQVVCAATVRHAGRPLCAGAAVDGGSTRGACDASMRR